MKKGEKGYKLVIKMIKKFKQQKSYNKHNTMQFLFPYSFFFFSAGHSPSLLQISALSVETFAISLLPL